MICSLSRGRRRPSPHHARWRPPVFSLALVLFCAAIWSFSIVAVSQASPLEVGAAGSAYDGEVGAEHEPSSTESVVSYLTWEDHKTSCVFPVEVNGKEVLTLHGTEGEQLTATVVVPVAGKWLIGENVGCGATVYERHVSLSVTGIEGKEGKEGPAGKEGPPGPEGKAGVGGSSEVTPSSTFSAQIDQDVQNLEVVLWLLLGSVIGVTILFLFTKEWKPS